MDPRARKRHRLALLALPAALAALLLLPSGASASLPPNVGFGTHLFIDTTTDIPTTLQMAHDAGANVIRLGVGWNRIETANNVYNQSQVARLDSIVNGASALGMGTLLNLKDTPCWASSDRNPITGNCPDSDYWKYAPNNSSDYGDFVAWLTSRYGSELAGVEVWNEANNADQFKSNAPSVAYAQLVSAAHQSRTNGVPIVAGALWHGSSDPNSDLKFMDQLFLQPGFATSFDIWSFHAYAPTTAGVVNLVQQRRTKLTNKGSSAPIWVDEFGWSTCTASGCVSQASQRDLLVATFPALTQPNLGVTGALSYDFRDDGTDPADPEQNFGIVTNSYAKKLAYDAVAGCLTGATC